VSLKGLEGISREGGGKKTTVKGGDRLGGQNTGEFMKKSGVAVRARQQPGWEKVLSRGKTWGSLHETPGGILCP